jgi:hypothetical protein
MFSGKERKLLALIFTYDMEHVSIQNLSIGRNNDLEFFMTSTKFTISCHSYWRWQGLTEPTLTQNPDSTTSPSYEYKP